MKAERSAICAPSRRSLASLLAGLGSRVRDRSHRADTARAARMDRVRTAHRAPVAGNVRGRQ